MTAMRAVTAGFMPLLDSAILVAAKEKGFAESEGIDLGLVRETSWANIRDRLAVGHFDAAHVLAPMPIACNLGLTPLRSPCLAPMALGLGGNAVTVSNALWADMAAAGADSDLDPRSTGEALNRVAQARVMRSLARLRFAVVHPHSGHNYELRYWLAACGVNPARDVDIVIVPPPLMADALASGALDGYCVGEPWNTAAVIAGAGRIATVKAAIWRSSPEKVLGVGGAWARENADTLAALLRALCRSAQWCGEAANCAELAAILSGAAYLARPAEWLMPALSGVLMIGASETRAMTSEAAKSIQESGVMGNCETRAVEGFFVPFANAATFPWKSHALWFYSQMVRWGQIEHGGANAAIARDAYRPDIYREALKPLGVALPAANSKVEGALTAATPVGSAGASLVLGPDGFFDEARFDPDRLDEYIEGQSRLRRSE